MARTANTPTQMPTTAPSDSEPGELAAEAVSDDVAVDAEEDVGTTGDVEVAIAGFVTTTEESATRAVVSETLVLITAEPVTPLAVGIEGIAVSACRL